MPHRHSTSSLRVARKPRFMDKRDWTLYLYLLLGSGLTLMLSVGGAIFVVNDHFDLMD